MEDFDDDPLKKYLRKGEGETIEFKQTLNSEYKIAKTICALANTTGGVILVGVKDDKNISGVDPEEEKHILIKASDFCCDPPVTLEFEEFDRFDEDRMEERTILKVIVKESSEKPHYALTKNGDWVAYLRQNDKTLIAGNKAVTLMKQNEPPVSTDLTKNEKRLLSYLEKNERITLKKYMDIVNISAQRARKELNDALDKGIIRVLEHEKENYYTL